MESFSFWAPTFAILLLEENQCPADFKENGWGNITYEEKTQEWHRRMQEIQGEQRICERSLKYKATSQKVNNPALKCRTL